MSDTKDEGARVLKEARERAVGIDEHARAALILDLLLGHATASRQSLVVARYPMVTRVFTDALGLDPLMVNAWIREAKPLKLPFLPTIPRPRARP